MHFDFLSKPIFRSDYSFIHVATAQLPRHVQNCDKVETLNHIKAKGIFTEFELWENKLSMKWVRSIVVGIRSGSWQKWKAKLVDIEPCRRNTTPVFHDDVIKWKLFLVTDPLRRESTSRRWITKASYTVLWCFLWSPPVQTVKQIIGVLVIWDAIAPIMMSL